MPTVFNSLKMELKTRQSPLPEFSWKSSPRLAKIVHSEDFEFDIRSLEPGRFSFPYHFHRNAEHKAAAYSTLVEDGDHTGYACKAPAPGRLGGQLPKSPHAPGLIRVWVI